MRLKTLLPFRTYDELPPRHAQVVRSAWKNVTWIVSIATALAMAFASWAIWGRGSTFLAAMTIAIWCVILIMAFMTFFIVYFDYRLILYFERPVGQIETYPAGHAIAIELRRLDEYCRSAGCAPLSSFGFNDDLLGETLEWHQAEDGLKTIQSLVDVVNAESIFSAHQPALIDDFTKWRYALERARDQKIRFCILWQFGSSTSGQEWSIRKGTAF